MQERDIANKKNALLYKLLCNFIATKFLLDIKNKSGETISQNAYAKECGITSSTITKLKSNEGYDIPISTIYSICRRENYSLEQLFREFEEQYGINILD